VLHAGYGPDPTTRAVAVPIYQTVAYAFDGAEHGSALFNLEAEGFRYSRISNPTNAVLKRRLAALEGCVEALSEHVDDIVAGLDQALHAAGAER
jgi:O-acetylhomoserine (thiol)-lyase